MIGIDDMSFYVPRQFLPIEELANKREIAYEKLNKGLGLESMALADTNEDAASMAANAVLQLILKNKLNPKDIGRIYVGSESAFDGAKPIASYVHGMLSQYFALNYGEQAFKNTDAVDYTFACIAGVDAMQNTLDWVRADPSRMGIVVSTDNAKYELESTGEYTQGAGAVAILIKDNPRLAVISEDLGIATNSEHDFFKPLRKMDVSTFSKQLKMELSSQMNLGKETAIDVHSIYPVFDGQYSNECYSNRVQEAYAHFMQQRKGSANLEDWDRVVFHLPYAFHGKRVFVDIFWSQFKENAILKEQLLEMDANFFENPNLKLVAKTKMYREYVLKHIEKGQRASSLIGNLYTGSIFMSFMSLLEAEWTEKQDLEGKTIGFCAYGSGSKAKVFEAKIQKEWKSVVAKFNLFSDLEKRKAIDFETYEKLHSNTLEKTLSERNNGFGLMEISSDSALYGVRSYQCFD